MITEDYTSLEVAKLMKENMNVILEKEIERQWRHYNPIELLDVDIVQLDDIMFWSLCKRFYRLALEIVREELKSNLGAEHDFEACDKVIKNNLENLI